jgi:uroporphyrinogen decarboxylase
VQPALAAEVTIQPVDILGVDAAIIFSDILVIPEAIGLPYEMIPQKGPFFPNTVRTQAELDALHPVQNSGNLDHTYEAIRITKQKLAGRVPVIGFAGAPWTIFSYMTEGSGSKSFSVAKALLYAQPAFAHALLQRITDATIIYLKGQIAAGADIVQIFDSWAGALDRHTFTTFSLPYIRQICEAIQDVPKIVFAKGAFFSLADMDALDCQVLGLDWHTPVEMATSLVKTKAFQGNADPCMLYASPEGVQRETLRMLESFPPHRHIANLGHGLNPDTPRESLFAFVETVKAFRYV